MKQRLTHLAVSILLAAVGMAVAPAAAAEFQVWPSNQNQELPDIDGTIVVFQQFQTSPDNNDIRVADIANPANIWSTTIGDANDQQAPAVWGEYVVYQDYIIEGDSSDWDIALADINDRSNPAIFPISQVLANDELSPAISGNIVIWQDGLAGDYDIYGADITDLYAPVEFAVIDDFYSQQKPAIYHNTALWEDDLHGDFDIYGADIWLRNDPGIFTVAGYEMSEQQNAAISGNMVVWQDNEFGDWDIFAADISDPNNRIEIAVASEPNSQENPDIDGNLIVFQDDVNGHWDIYGYNITTAERFRITSEPHDQINPAVNGKTVVFQDNRSGVWNIYAITLGGVDIARCTSRPAGDVNGDCRFDFEDLAISMASWLDCNFDIAAACAD